TGEEGFTVLDVRKARALRSDTALPAIKQMNKASVVLIEDMGLSVKSFDVPGGRDIDANDHSDTV
ncbi:MAG: hypothetical protein ACPHCI_08165, partial [Solirubrobacterales bacterium]